MGHYDSCYEGEERSRRKDLTKEIEEQLKELSVSQLVQVKGLIKKLEAIEDFFKLGELFL